MHASGAPPLRGIHWSVLRNTKGTVWEALASPDGSGAVQQMRLEKGVVSALHELFQQQKKGPEEGGGGRGEGGGASGGTPGKGRGASGGGPKVVALTRANNVAIMLTQFKMQHDAIHAAILSGDPQKLLSFERLSLLLQVSVSGRGGCELGCSSHWDLGCATTALPHWWTAVLPHWCTAVLPHSHRLPDPSRSACKAVFVLHPTPSVCTPPKLCVRTPSNRQCALHSKLGMCMPSIRQHVHTT